MKNYKLLIINGSCRPAGEYITPAAKRFKKILATEVTEALGGNPLITIIMVPFLLGEAVNKYVRRTQIPFIIYNLSLIIYNLQKES
jgi:hypothetical protein